MNKKKYEGKKKKANPQRCRFPGQSRAHRPAPWGMVVLATCWVLGIMFKHVDMIVLFAWLISYIFSANERYFFLTTNQLTVLLVMIY